MTMIGQRPFATKDGGDDGSRAEVRLRCECGRQLIIRGGKYETAREAVRYPGEQRVVTCGGCRVVWALVFQGTPDGPVVVDAMNTGRIDA